MGEGGVETAAPIVAISVLHALSLIFAAIVVPKAGTPRSRTFMRIFLYGGMATPRVSEAQIENGSPEPAS